MCDIHGGGAPQVRRRAAEQLIMTADQAAQTLVRMMEDTEVPFGVRAKIAQDLLDRAGLVATQVHKIVPTAEDPIMRFFEGAFSDPSNWVSTPAARSDTSDRELRDQHPLSPRRRARGDRRD